MQRMSETGSSDGAGAARRRDRERALVYCKLPDDIASRHVLLLDPILPGGYSAVRAIEALLVRTLPCPAAYASCIVFTRCVTSWPVAALRRALEANTTRSQSTSAQLYCTRILHAVTHAL